MTQVENFDFRLTPAAFHFPGRRIHPVGGVHEYAAAAEIHAADIQGTKIGFQFDGIKRRRFMSAC
jgi:hypothetical protein